MLFAAIVDYFAHDSPWVLVGAGVGAVGGFYLSWYNQKKNPPPKCPTCGKFLY